MHHDSSSKPNTGQYIPAPVNCIPVSMVVSKQSRVVTFLDHDKRNRGLIIWFQGCTCLNLDLMQGLAYNTSNTTKQRDRKDVNIYLPYELHQVHKVKLDRTALHLHHPCTRVHRKAQQAKISTVILR